MATIPEKATLTDKVLPEEVIPKKVIKERTIEAHTVPQVTIPSRIKYPNKNIVISDVAKGEVVKIKVEVDGGASVDISDYTIPTIPKEKIGLLVVNVRFKLSKIPPVEDEEK